MTLSKLNNREQLLIALVFLFIIWGVYSFFYFIPKNNQVSTLQLEAEQTEQRLLTANIPDDPEEGMDELLRKLNETEETILLITEMEESVSQRLAPFDSQQLKVLISQLARNSGVRINTNEVYKTKVSTLLKKKKKKKKKKKLIKEVKSDLILDESRSWIDRMSSGTMFHRPMQRLVLEGSYLSLRSFIHGLEQLEWQVTIVKLNISKMPTAPLQGFPQNLKSELILAL